MSVEPDRITGASGGGDDGPFDRALRPTRLAEYVGQRAVKEQMALFIEAARRARRLPRPHADLRPARASARRRLRTSLPTRWGVALKATSGPVLEKRGDLAAQLTNLDTGDVLFIDEIHRLLPAVEEILYPAMEDGKLDLLLGDGPAAKSIKLELNRFTLVGATTARRAPDPALRDRFGIVQRLEFYDIEELAEIVTVSRRQARHSRCRGRRAGGRPPLAGHAAGRQPPAAPRARTTRRSRPTGASRRGPAAAALAMLEVDDRGLDGMGPARPRHHRRQVRRRPPSASTRSPRRSARSATPSRTSSSRSSSRRDS